MIANETTLHKKPNENEIDNYKSSQYSKVIYKGSELTM